MVQIEGSSSPFSNLVIHFISVFDVAVTMRRHWRRHLSEDIHLPPPFLCVLFVILHGRYNPNT
jgi:hypothetical protein